MGASFSGGGCPGARPRSHASSRGDGRALLAGRPVLSACGEAGPAGEPSAHPLGSEQKEFQRLASRPDQAHAFLYLGSLKPGCAFWAGSAWRGRLVVRFEPPS